MKKKISKILLKSALALAAIAAIIILTVNFAFILSAERKTYELSDTDIPDKGEYDCILVLGSGVKADGSPSDMLYDRIKTAVDLYFDGYSNKLLMSGDHGQDDYDEVNCMKNTAISMGVPSEDIFMDHAGFSTYESIVRAKNIFSAEKIIVVTQEYHLPRALYLAKTFSIEAVGVSASLRHYSGQEYRDIREVAARIKDFIYSLAKPEVTGGDKISLEGDGNITNDK